MSMPLELGLGAWGAHAGTWLKVSSWGALLMLGLPMALWPLQWARLLKWATRPDDHLAIYFGRALGMVASAMALTGIVSADHPSTWPVLFNLTLLVYAGSTLMHIWGALRRIQPLSETLEIPVWLALAGLQLLFYPDVQWRWA